MNRTIACFVIASALLISVAHAEYCPKCGVKMIDDARFCYKCGIKIPDASGAEYKQPPTNAVFNIVVRPSQARVFLDGQEVGPGTHDVKPGIYHNVRVECDDYSTYARDVSVRAGRTANFRIALQEKEEWYSGPRIGASLFTGLFGMEFQRQHIGLAFGFGTLAGAHSWEDASVSAGARYYARPYRSSWYLGLGYQVAENTKGSGPYRSEETYEIAGLAVGYRWRFGSGWDLSTGFGPARWFEKVKDFEGTGRPPNTSRGDGLYFAPAGEIAFGYSF